MPEHVIPCLKSLNYTQLHSQYDPNSLAKVTLNSFWNKGGGVCVCVNTNMYACLHGLLSRAHTKDFL